MRKLNRTHRLSFRLSLVPQLYRAAGKWDQVASGPLLRPRNLTKESLQCVPPSSLPFLSLGVLKTSYIPQFRGMLTLLDPHLSEFHATVQVRILLHVCSAELAGLPSSKIVWDLTLGSRQQVVPTPNLATSYHCRIAMKGLLIFLS
ncbi:hypothetical protein J6590_063553 [Homalodisca vitripennis]|nr:hypothetical protein J6590_063553 [Homalodisca vitripennis]